MTAPARKRGRPPLAEHTIGMQLKAPLDSYTRWVAAAEAAGVPLAEWVRRALDRVARR